MSTLFLCLSLLLAAVQFIPVDSALPCSHPLRRYLPHRFTHCRPCTYGEWSPWRTSIPLQVMAVPNRTCESEEARKFQRFRKAFPGTTCDPDIETEHKYECKQSQTTMDFEQSMYCLHLYLYSRCSNTEGEGTADC